jgi:hypothetical protein
LIKLNFFIINVFVLISFFNVNQCLSNEYFYIKQTFFSTDPKPSISATSTDGGTKWFDDYPSATSKNELEFGFYLPKNYGLSFRNNKLNGVHKGEATKYVCILGYCSYVGAGIVTGNSTTDKISYDINSWQVILDRSYEFNNRLTFKPRIGINVLDTILKYSGAGQNVKETQVVPLPFLGLYSEIKIDSEYSIYFDTNYFKYQQTKVGVHYYDTSIGINRKINKFLNFYLGYKKYDLGISNKGGSSNISFHILQKTPFMGFSLSY